LSSSRNLYPRNQAPITPNLCTFLTCNFTLKVYHLNALHRSFQSTLNPHPLKMYAPEISHKCPHCNFTYSFVSVGLKHYFNTHFPHSHLFKPNQCRECYQEFGQHGNRRRHEIAIHLKPIYQCTKCHKEYKSIANLDSHIKRCHGTNCENCPSCTRIAINYFPCEVKKCNKLFKRCENLDEHVRIVHQQPQTISRQTIPYEFQNADINPQERQPFEPNPNLADLMYAFTDPNPELSGQEIPLEYLITPD
jgi:hypothetical protein